MKRRGKSSYQGVSVLCLWRVKEKVQTQGFPLCCSSPVPGGTHRCQRLQGRGHQATAAGRPGCRTSTGPLPSSSSLEDKAVFLLEKWKKQFNLCLHSRPTSRSCSRTGPETSHVAPTPTPTLHQSNRNRGPCLLPAARYLEKHTGSPSRNGHVTRTPGQQLSS